MKFLVKFSNNTSSTVDAQNIQQASQVAIIPFLRVVNNKVEITEIKKVDEPKISMTDLSIYSTVYVYKFEDTDIQFILYHNNKVNVIQGNRYFTKGRFWTYDAVDSDFSSLNEAVREFNKYLEKHNADRN